MEELDIIINIVSKSIDKNGEDKILTLGHLKNLLNMANNIYKKEKERQERDLDRAMQDALIDDYCGDG